MYGGRTVSSSVLCVVLEYICVMIVGILVQCMDGLTLLSMTLIRFLRFYFILLTESISPLLFYPPD